MLYFISSLSSEQVASYTQTMHYIRLMKDADFKERKGSIGWRDTRKDDMSLRKRVAGISDVGESFEFE